MHHADIFCLLTKQNVTLTSIAKEEKVTVGVVSEVIRGKKRSFAVATAIAVKAKRSLNTLWPGEYKHTPRPLRRASAQSRVAA